MKDRIQQIMMHEGMNQQEFSRASGIAPASLSSIFTGRTSPTLKHAEALHQHFPRLNMSWLLFGDGEMMLPDEDQSTASSSTTAPDSASSPLPASPSAPAPASSLFDAQGSQAPYAPYLGTPQSPVFPPSDAPMASVYPQQIPVELLKKLDTKPRRIAEIRIFFDDGTFEVFPGNL